MSDIYKRWGRELGSGQKLLILKNRLEVLFGGKNLEATKTQAMHFAFRLGKDLAEATAHADFTNQWYIRVGSLLDSAVDSFEVASVMEALFDCGVQTDADNRTLANIINKSDCGIRLKSTQTGWQSYPAGEQYLDAELVDRPLSFLEGDPLTEYSKALDHYSSGKWEECAEKTRRALEEYLRLKLNNKKGLDSNLAELGRKLKAGNLPVHLRNTLMGILKKLDDHYNASSKHNSNTYDEIECEFLIYLVGLLMRVMEKIDVAD